MATSPLMCIRCLYEACPTASPSWRFRLPYYSCARHARTATPALARRRRAGRVTRQTPAPGLVCGTCGQDVLWQDAVATEGDHVVHAWCHSLLARYPLSAGGDERSERSG